MVVLCRPATNSDILSMMDLGLVPVGIGGTYLALHTYITVVSGSPTAFGGYSAILVIDCHFRPGLGLGGIRAGRVIAYIQLWLVTVASSTHDIASYMIVSLYGQQHG